MLKVLFVLYLWAITAIAGVGTHAPTSQPTSQVQQPAPKPQVQLPAQWVICVPSVRTEQWYRAHWEFTPRNPTFESWYLCFIKPGLNLSIDGAKAEIEKQGLVTANMPDLFNFYNLVPLQDFTVALTKSPDDNGVMGYTAWQDRRLYSLTEAELQDAMSHSAILAKKSKNN